MKSIILIVMFLFTTALYSQTDANLSDAIDKNEVPAEIEEREEEVINKPDALDKNQTPAILEDREQKEQWREDYSEEQYDTIKRQNKKR